MRVRLNNLVKSQKVNLNNDRIIHSEATFHKTSQSFEPKVEITPVEKDIYPDEVIYYDGGNVEGYGYDKE